MQVAITAVQFYSVILLLGGLCGMAAVLGFKGA